MEFLVRNEVRIPPGMFTEEEIAEIYAKEQEKGRELAEAGVIKRLWRIPGRRANIGLWEAPDATALHKVLSSLPIFPFLDIVEVIPTAAHPSDPVTRHLA